MVKIGTHVYPTSFLHIGHRSSTKESPFFLLYGRDPKLPTEATLVPPRNRSDISIDDYKAEVIQSMQEAWELARKNVKVAQRRQKKSYDRHSQQPTFQVGGRVFLYTPSAKSGPRYKFALPHKGPFRVLDISDNVACIQLIEKPGTDPLRVAIN